MTPSPELARAFNDWFNPPKWVSGGINRDDGLFLLAMMEREKPRNVMEIGVAAGVSSAVLLWWLTKQEHGRLVSTDVRETCYFDKSIPIGSATYEMVKPGLRWSLFDPRNPTHPETFKELSPFDFAFVDGSHRHPHPTNDVLGLLDYVVPGSWVALHDIRLMSLYPHLTPYPDYGPQILFEHWVGEKIDGGKNIGAIRLYDGCEEELRMIRKIEAPTKHPGPNRGI